MKIKCTCPLCDTAQVIGVRESDYVAWKNGSLAQDAFPYLDADERETLISGICPQWEEAYVVGL